MNLDNKLFKYRAEIDFVQIRFTTSESTNAFTVRRKSGLSYVKPLNKGSGAAATEYLARVYDISNWLQFINILQRLKSAVQLVSEPTISAVEVSIDAYSKKLNHDEMIKHVVNFAFFSTFESRNNRRFTSKSLTTSTVHDYDKMIKRVADGGTIYIGSHKENAACVFT